jgi:aldehyde dehydrogenase (NAD+)
MENPTFKAGFINNQFITGEGEAFSVENPSNGETLAHLTGLSVTQVKTAIEAARQAFDQGGWSSLSNHQRTAHLRRYVDCLKARAEDLSQTVFEETGCPKHTSVMHAQVSTPLRQADDICNLYQSLPELEENPLPLAERASPMGHFVQSLRRYTPIGVVSAIAAYNMPFYTALWKVLPALITGNTVILRPNPLTPLSAMAFAEAALEAELPAGVINIVIEAGADGAQLLTTDTDVDMVAFTGSSHVGAQVMAQASASMKRLQLELGGKSAQLFLPDALDKAVTAPLGICAAHAGQGCALGTRIFVPQEHKAELLQKMAAAMSTLKVGRSDAADTQVGPVINAAAVERCERIVADAVAAGARIVSGGRRPEHLDSGYFFEPTLLDVPDNKNPAAQQEVFGPVVSVIGYRDIDHAVAMANDSDFGLSGYVFGQDRQQALAVATRIKSGTVNVNTGVFSAYASSGGQRLSGVGRERGIEGLRVYQQISCLNLGG